MIHPWSGIRGRSRATRIRKHHVIGRSIYSLLLIDEFHIEERLFMTRSATNITWLGGLALVLLLLGSLTMGG